MRAFLSTRNAILTGQTRIRHAAEAKKAEKRLAQSPILPPARPQPLGAPPAWRVRLGLVLLTVAILYSASLDLRLFGDDFIAWSKVLFTLRQPWWRLFGAYYNPEFYRPFEHLLIRFNVWMMGTDPLLYRLATIGGHLLMVWGVFWFARRWRLSAPEAVGAALFFGLSQANGMAVLSNDAACLIYSTFCGTVAMGLLVRRYDDEPVAAWTGWHSAVWMFASLLWKDSGIGYAPALALLGAVEVWRAPRGGRLRRALALAVPFALVLAVYFALRTNAGATGIRFSPNGRYDIWFGLNVPVNIVLFLLGLLTPVGTSIIVLRTGDLVFLSICALAVLDTTALFVAGLRRLAEGTPARRNRVIMLLVLMFVVMTPDIFMNAVSELYLYKPNVLFATLFGPSLLALFVHAWRAGQRYVQWLLVAFLLLLVVSQAFSVTHKLSRLRDNGLRTQQIMNEIKSQMPVLASPQVIAVNRYPGPAPLYSIYYMEGVYVLGGTKALEFLYHQKLTDFRYYSFDKLEEGLARMPGRKVVILYLRDHVHVAVTDGSTNPFDPILYR